MPSLSVPRAAGDQVGELCAKIRAGMFRIASQPEGATEKLAALVEQAYPYFRLPATTWRSTSPTTRSPWRWNPRADATQGLRPASRPSPMLDGPGYEPPDVLATRSCLSLLRVDTRVGTARVARRKRGGRPGVTTSFGPTGPGRWRCSVASTRRARILAETRAELAERGAGSLAREYHRLRVGLGRALGRRSRRRRRVRRARGGGCTRSSGNENFHAGRGREPGAGALRARPARRGRRLGGPRR